MVQTLSYATILKKKLIDEFKQKFYEKLGYHPIVVTKVTIAEQEVPILTLEELLKCFNKHVPRGKDGRYLSLKSKKRDRELVDLRKIFCTLAKSMGYTLNQIGKFLGSRDHTTVIHNINMFKSLFETNDAFKSKYYIILRTITEKYGTSIMENINPTQSQPKPDLSVGLLSIKDQAFQDNQ